MKSSKKKTSKPKKICIWCQIDDYMLHQPKIWLCPKCKKEFKEASEQVNKETS